jgi:hypothetical protein
MVVATISSVTRRRILTLLTVTLTLLFGVLTLQLSGVTRGPAEFDTRDMIDKVVFCTNLDLDAVDPSLAVTNVTKQGTELQGIGPRLGCAYKVIPAAASVAQAQQLLDALAEAGRLDPAARSACHDLAHEVGTKAWRSLGNKALTVGLDSCGYGYYHGAMRESIVGEDDPRSGVERLREFCSRQVAQYDVSDRRQFISWKLCAHGVGHALGGAVTELGLGIDLCGPIRTELVDDGDVTCVTGLLNELSVGSWGLRVTTTSVALQRCAAVPARYKQVCSSYSNFYADIPLDTLTKECNTLNDEYVEGCWEAVARSANHEVLFTGGDSEGARLLERPREMAAYVENLCASDRGYSCFEGFFTELSQFALDPPKLVEVCRALADQRRSMACEQAMSEMAAFHTI